MDENSDFNPFTCSSSSREAASLRISSIDFNSVDDYRGIDSAQDRAHGSTTLPSLMDQVMDVMPYSGHSAVTLKAEDQYHALKIPNLPLDHLYQAPCSNVFSGLMDISFLRMETYHTAIAAHPWRLLGTRSSRSNPDCLKKGKGSSYVPMWNRASFLQQQRAPLAGSPPPPPSSFPKGGRGRIDQF